MNPENQDIRWQQRFNSYQKAFLQFDKVFLLSKEKDLNDLEKDALIQRFEYTHELAWKVMKDRNPTGHVCNEDVAESVTENILGSYAKEFIQFAKTMVKLK